MESGEMDLLSKKAILSLPRDVEKSLDGKILDEYINVKDIEALPTVQSQSTAGQLNDGARSTAQSTNLIDRQAAIDVLKQFKPEIIPYEKARSYVEETIDTMYNRIEALPTIQPEPSIPLSWIENEIEWIKSRDNTFSEITAIQISAMVMKWRDEKK